MSRNILFRCFFLQYSLLAYPQDVRGPLNYKFLLLIATNVIILWATLKAYKPLMKTLTSVILPSALRILNTS